jgi:transcription initiation factor IIF auxiliary subunit
MQAHHEYMYVLSGCRIVIGNISKWVPVDTREDAASHKWMMYVRGPKEAPDVSDFVSKVRFFLHPSYRPHDIAEVMYVRHSFQLILL